MLYDKATACILLASIAAKVSIGSRPAPLSCTQCNRHPCIFVAFRCFSISRCSGGVVAVHLCPGQDADSKVAFVDGNKVAPPPSATPFFPPAPSHYLFCCPLLRTANIYPRWNQLEDNWNLKNLKMSNKPFFGIFGDFELSNLLR